MASDTEARVYDILGKLQSLDKVRELFSELNYDPARELLSRQNWGRAAADALAEDPQVIASHDDFKVIYARLNSDRLLLGDERPVVNRLLQEHPYLLCLFSDSEQQQWHFVNIKYDEEIKKRRLFRRITVGPNERLRTATERLSQLDLERIRPELAGIYPLDIQQRHDEAFDIEVVTKEFYNTFVELFHQIKDEIATNNPSYKNEAPTEAQMLLNRLMFLYFIQKKGWLDNNPHYLWEKFQEHYGSEPRGHSFYSDFLIRLFQQLSNEQLKFDDLGDIPFLNGGLFETEPFSSQLPFDLQISSSTFGDIFDKLLEHFNFTVREDTPLDVEVAIDPEMLGRIFENLILQLERERDLRKMTGSYYTPRVIVHFMCQQALKEYLATESQIDPSRLEMLLELNPPDQLEDWEVDLLKDIVTVPEARALRDLAKRAFVLDPAVGSGAFLVGMLHEMLTIVKQMDVREHGPECIARRNYDYEFKRDIIESCLYGVDILEQAVRTCELRLWLSLVVDYDRELGEDVPPLPNLSYQVKQGDSLIETLFGQHVQFDTLTRTNKGRQLIDEIQQEKHAYFLTRGLKEKRQKELSIIAKQCELAEILVKEKRQSLGTSQRLFGELSTKEARQNEEIKQRVASLDKLLHSAANAKQKARAWLEGKLPATSTDINRLRQELDISFIWQLDFAEVFKEKGGFDVVIANPPYIRISGIAEELDRAIRKEYVTVFGNYDIYIAFIELGINLLRNNGLLTHITPNKFLTKKYANKLRPFMLDNGIFLNIVDTSQARTFDSSSVYPLVFVYRKKKLQHHPVKTAILTDLNFESFFKSSRQTYDYVLDQEDFRKNKNSMIDIFVNPAIRRLIDRISTNCSSLGSYSRLLTGTPAIDKFYEWAAFIKDEEQLTTSERKQALKFINVSNLDRYVIKWGKEVRAFKKRLAMPYLVYDDTIGTNKWQVFQKKKIVIKGTALALTAAYDDVGYANLSLYAVLFDEDHNDMDKTFFLLGLLNSKLLNFWYCTKFATSNISGNYITFNAVYLEQLLIRECSYSKKKPIIDFVRRILSIVNDEDYLTNPVKQSEVRECELKIDQLVYDLYELTPDEITVIENAPG